MPHTVDEAVLDELRGAGLPGRGTLPRLLALLRGSPETHLTLAEMAEMAAEAGLAVTPADLHRQVEALADHGLIGRVPTTTTDLVFDTVAEPHFHFVYEESEQVVDLHVSAETLLVMVRDALVRRPGAVDVIVRFRRGPAAAP
jgi:Fe2+ or Zn2+ uptake regulation protein